MTSDPLLRGWLNRAAEQARALGHDFSAASICCWPLLADADPGLAVIFQRSGLSHEVLERAVVDAISGETPAQVVLLDEGVSRGAEPAVNLNPKPSRFIRRPQESRRRPGLPTSKTGHRCTAAIRASS